MPTENNEKYYYMRLKENFYNSDEIIILEGLPDGYLYSNILLKLYLKSLKNNGKLVLNDFIPYNSDMLAQITRHPVGVVEKALEAFRALGLIDVLESGAIYMLNIQEFIGKTSTEADRVRRYRKKIESEKKLLLDDGQMSYKSTPEIEIETELELEEEIETEDVPDTNVGNISPPEPPKPEKPTKPVKHIYGEYKHVRLTDEEVKKLGAEYGEALTDEAVVYLDEYIEMKGYKAKSHYLAIRKWVIDAVKEKRAKQQRQFNQNSGRLDFIDNMNL